MCFRNVLVTKKPLIKREEEKTFIFFQISESEEMEKGLQGIHRNKQLLLITPGNAQEQLVSSIITASASHKGLVFLFTTNIFIATMRTEE